MSVKPFLDSAFNRDKFLLRQKHFSFSAKYYVWDEKNQPILYVERPSHFLHNLLAAFAAVFAALFVAVILMVVGGAFQNEILLSIFFLAALLGFFFTFFVIYILLSKKRDVTFYRDNSKKEILLEVFQEEKFQFPYANYSIKEPQGQVLARLRKNYLYDIFRKRWDCYSPDGLKLCVVREDSIVRAILRRFLGVLFGLLKTNFVIYGGKRDRIIGQFNRKFTLFDRYILDMSNDSEKLLDRRIAIAIGVMLDTGERR